MTDATTARRRERMDEPDDLGPISATPDLMVTRALAFADVSPDDIVYDLGCNDGRVCVAAALERGARSVGIEIDPGACAVARERAARANALLKKDLVRVEEASAFDASASEATVVFSYLLPKGNAKLGAKLLKELKPGSRVVTYLFKMPEETWGEKLTRVESFARSRARAAGGVDSSAFNKLYLYVV
jgi:SAM-dependent methyltransferase